jgi:hypothetical protein
MPIMKQTVFKKFIRSYCLEWHDNTYGYKAYYNVCVGSPMIAIEQREYDEELGRCKTKKREVKRPTIEQLRKYNLVEEI